jgi:hypothetical protein
MNIMRNWLAVCLICLFAPAAAWAQVQATLHVAPNGNDENSGAEDKPFATIEKARQAVRAVNKNMTGDIVVMLGGGTYRIDRTLAFDAADSGTGGHRVIYRAQAGQTPIISGGKPLTDWKQGEKGRWQAPAPLDDFRQLYVDGKRATRARGQKPAGLESLGDEGYKTTDVGMADWKNPDDLEFCYQVVWGHTRCKVQGIKRNGDRAVITMLQPYFSQARAKEGVQIDNHNAISDMYVENALELLDEPGEWYLDRKAKIVYYMPRPGEDMTKVEVIAPALERLVELRGTLDQPVHDIQFAGITFEHGSWLQPSRIGLVDVQANFLLDWKNPMKRADGLTAVHNEQIKIPSNIVCHAAHSVRFDRCTFTRLGAGAVDLECGSQDNQIVGCRFHDISSSAVQVGDVLRDDHHPDDMRKIVKNNTVANCYIHDCGKDYADAVGVFVGYTEGTVLAHNEIASMPYSGVSMGWGWGEEDAGGGVENYYMPYKYATPTPAKNNRVEYNHIHGVMSRLHDGGGIYTLGNQPGTVIRGNHVHDNGSDSRGPGGIYLDEGSGFIEITGNLTYNVPTTAVNYNNGNQNRKDTCKEHDNFLGVKPEEHKDVVEKAGLEAEYRDLLKNP